MRIVLLLLFIVTPSLLCSQTLLKRAEKIKAELQNLNGSNPFIPISIDTVSCLDLWGQSNAVGRDSVGNIPAQYEYLMDTIVGSQISFVGNSPEVIIAGETSDPFRGFRDFGFEVSLADTLYKSTDQTYYMLKHAVGSSWLANKGGTTDWNVHNPHPSSIFKRHLSILDRFQQSLWQQSKVCKWIAVIGMQGENDAIELADAQAYADNLGEFVDSLRNFFGDPNLPFLFGEVNGIYDPVMVHRDTVRQKQYDVIRYEVDSSGVSSDTEFTRDYTYLIDTDTYTFIDEVHYDAASTVQFGWDIFRVLKLAGVIPEQQ